MHATLEDGLVHIGHPFFVRTGRTILMVEALEAVFQGTYGVEQLVAGGKVYPAYQAHASQQGAISALRRDLASEVHRLEHELVVNRQALESLEQGVAIEEAGARENLSRDLADLDEDALPEDALPEEAPFHPQEVR